MSPFPFSYDPDGRLSSVVNPAGLGITYGYDAASQRSTMNQSTGLFTYIHDPIGRIATLMNPEGQVTSWLYDAASRVKATLTANGTLASNTYDSADQLLLLANLTSSGTTLSSFSYTYNPVGNRTQVVESNGNVVTWTYDPTYQLTNEQRSGANSYNISYVYDQVGNRTLLVNGGAPTTSTYNAANELATSQTSAGVTTRTYDGSGNLLTSQAPGNQWTTNSWDGEDRLTRVALPSGIVDSFTYNGDGLRVQKQDSTGTTNHVWDGQNILLETNASNIIQAVYTLEPVFYGSLISQSRGGVDSFYLFDALGSTRQLASSTGSVTDSYLYDSFGNSLVTSGTTVNWFRFVGREGYEFSGDTGQYLLIARVYSPVTGRFLSRDPIGIESGDFNFYRYVNNLPSVLTDPSGLQLGSCPSCKNVCGQAAALGLKPGKVGGIVCCGGRAYTCEFWPTKKYRFQWECTLQHEATHVNDVWCITNGLYFPSFTWGKSQKAEECEAYRVSVKCIKGYSTECDSFFGIAAVECLAAYYKRLAEAINSCTSNCGTGTGCT
jgi:RHS repeat-associated protein